MTTLKNRIRKNSRKNTAFSGQITNEIINKLSTWKHSGFSVDNGVQLKKEDKEGREAIAQYMMRNVFNTDNITYIEKTGKVIYRKRFRDFLKNGKHWLTSKNQFFII